MKLLPIALLLGAGYYFLLRDKTTPESDGVSITVNGRTYSVADAEALMQKYEERIEQYKKDAARYGDKPYFTERIDEVRALQNKLAEALYG